MVDIIVREAECTTVDNTRYGKYITRDCYNIPEPGKPAIYSTRHISGWGAGNFSIDSNYETEPHVLIDEPHSHEFDQYLCFLGTNPKDKKDFGAEIEICLGEEHEKYVINSPSVVWIAAGLIHGPIVITRVTSPFLFVDIATNNKYSRVSKSEKNQG
jgi:hypothetical protein